MTANWFLVQTTTQPCWWLTMISAEASWAFVIAASGDSEPRILPRFRLRVSCIHPWLA